jgi:hypothetical protein
MVGPYFSRAFWEAVIIFSTGKDSVAGTPRVKLITEFSDIISPLFLGQGYLQNWGQHNIEADDCQRFLNLANRANFWFDTSFYLSYTQA